MRRVMFICSNLGRGGAEKQLVYILEELAKTDSEIVLLNIGRVRDEFWESTVRALNIEYIHPSYPFRNVSRFVRVCYLIFKFRPHVVWGWHFFTTLYAYPAKWFTKFNLVAGVRNDVFYLKSQHWWALLLLPRVDNVVANSELVCRDLKQIIANRARVHFLPNIIDVVPRVEPREEVVTVGFCGNIHPRKGVDVYLKVAEILAKDHPELRFPIAGSGDVGYFVDQVADSNLADIVSFVGSVECIDAIANFDVFVLPSHHEGCPNVLLEAMSLGVPSVATSVGGVPEVVSDGVDGFMVPADDPQAIADKVGQLINSLELRKRFSRSAWTKMQARSSVEVIDNYLLVILDQ